jgi:hypothetical protein
MLPGRMKDVCTENADMYPQFLLMTYAITDNSIYDNKTESGEIKTNKIL